MARWLVPLLLLVGCVPPRTAIIVVVESDLDVPGRLASVHVEAGTSTHDFPLASGADLPFSFAIEPPGGDASQIAALWVDGRAASGIVIVSRSARVSFVPGQERVLRIRLDDACAAVACGAGTTCIAHGCVDEMVDGSTLPLLVPGRELDPLDSGPVDAGLADASDSRDAGDSGSSVPTSCREVPAGSASGVFEIDPDGPGGEAPFEVYCETTADEGGWALVAKVDGMSGGLGFADPAWLASSADGAPGTDDTTEGNALRPSYWLLPVSELRIVMQDADGTRSLVAPLEGPVPVRLRSAMDPGGTIRIGAALGEWSTLAGIALGDGMCVNSSVPADAGAVRVRIGVVASTDASCAPIQFWAGLGADADDQTGSCRATTITAGAASLCTPREEHPAFALVFAR